MSFENSSGEVLDRIMAFSHSGAPVKDLSRIKALLRAVGDPQDKLRFIHIAGTNGKGSTAEMFSEIFQAAGVRTGLFTSPYILEYADRIRVNGENIPYPALSELADIVLSAAEGLPCAGELSQFEMTQAIALLHFVREGCGIVVLETGLGGLLDCTNAVTTTVLSVITSVDYDHTAILGSTLPEIARQKAGIIKPGIPVVTSGSNAPEVIHIIRTAAAEKGSRVVITDMDELEVLEGGLEGTRFCYRGQEYSLAMGGAHQARNAAQVIEGCGILGIDKSAVELGLSRARVHARAEVIGREPTIILDGAHNPDAMGVLGAHLRANLAPGQRCIIAVGMCRDKDMRTALGSLMGIADLFITIGGFDPRAEDAKALAGLIEELGGEAEVYAGDPEGIKEHLKAKLGRDGIGVICGSLYLAARI